MSVTLRCPVCAHPLDDGATLVPTHRNARMRLTMECLGTGHPPVAIVPKPPTKPIRLTRTGFRGPAQHNQPWSRDFNTPRTP